MKSLLIKIIPKSLLLFYHKVVAYCAAVLYLFPSNNMVVIGVTGTNGKSTTVELIASVLKQAGLKVGTTSTIRFTIGDEVELNTKKMTMLGRFQLQKYLRRMYRSGCTHVVIETSSQGLEQNRHKGINYDVVVMTNLTPEHIEAHGGFEQYKKAKGKLFEHLMKKKHKVLNGKKIEKAIVVNGDDEHAPYFTTFLADKKYAYILDGTETMNGVKYVKANHKHFDDKVAFEVDGMLIELQLLGVFNILNSLAAYCVGRHLGVTAEKIKEGLESVTGVEGRLEFVDQGQDFSVVVDYAYEPVALEKGFKALDTVSHNKIIHVVGSCGGGRDKARQPIMGALSARYADYTIVTNEDPYDDDPMEIINAVAVGAIEKGAEEGVTLYKIEDRKEAIKKACKLAGPGDIVYITGKGSEQVMATKDGLVPWDDRQVARDVLKSFVKH